MNSEASSTISQKKHSCFYCQKLLCKIYRHYITVHKNEKDVREIIALPNKSGRRKLLLDNLRKKGDYLYNTTIKSRDQPDIVCKGTREGHQTLRDINVPCPRCKGYYSKLSLRHHIRKCMGGIPGKRLSNLQVEARKLMNNVHNRASDDLRQKIFPFFNDDEVTNAIRYDEAIILYGNYLCRKYTSEHNAPQIRSNLRSFGRLKLAMREENPNINEFFDVLDTSFVDLIINGIEKVSGLDNNTHLYRAPSTALLLATELKKLCKLLIMEFARKKDKDAQKKMEDLMLIFNLEFHVTINKRGMETQKINNRRRKTVLPKTDQIAQFRIYLENKIMEFISELEESFSLAAWTHLAQYTLVHLAVFNRKRPGETQRILIEDYRDYEILEDEDVADDTDTLSREQIKKWARIRFTGKLGKNTALLIHRSLGFRAIDLILHYRERAGVNASNRYVFGEPSNVHTQKTFQACQLIRNLAHESGIENSKLLRTRLLRQHLATETATSSVDQRLEGRVSDFMSHKRQIHQDYYVMTQKTDDITKVSQLLEDFSSNKKIHRGLDSPSTSSQANTSEVTPGNEHISQAKMNYLMGKKNVRRSWSTVEKDTAREYFSDEIFFGDEICRKKVLQFYNSNKQIYHFRTPHLIIQWVKCQRKKILAEEKGEKGLRVRWSTPEKEVLQLSTERHSLEGTTPTLAECELILEENREVLGKRTASSVKSFMYSEMKRKKT
ncbi:hypothetical protein WA026_011337 [Henosepilachna vigintioctopunctata]|uniref:Uncharacterized protein n=1 Tax=Henosepilachna vigintioctopunctata TaxID=420089 RepID=A0AAW1TX90_9CUCU